MTADVAAGGLKEKALRSAGWITLEKWGVRLCSISIFALLGRMLAPEDFGVVALALTFTSVLNIFVDSGFSTALVQRKELRPEHPATAFWVSLGLAAALAGLLCAAAPLLGQVLDEPRLARILQVMAVSLPLTAMSSVQQGLLEREFRFRALAVRRLVGDVTAGLLGLGLAIAGAGVWALVVQATAGGAVGTVVLWMATPWRPSLTFSREALGELWSFGGNVMGSELLARANDQSDFLLIGAVLGPTALGYYYVGSRIVNIVVELLTGVIATVALVTFARLQDDRARMVRAYLQMLGASATIGLPVLAALIAFAPQIIPIGFGDQWDQSIAIMQILAVSGAISTMAIFDKNLLLAAGEPRTVLRIQGGQTVLGLVLVAAALPFGIVAVAGARAVRQFVFWPIRMRVLRTQVGLEVRSYVGRVAHPLAVCAVLFGAVGALQWTSLPDIDPVLAFLVPAGAGAVGLYLAGMAVVAPDHVRELWRLAVGARNRKAPMPQGAGG